MVDEREQDNPELSARFRDKQVEEAGYHTTADKILGLLKDEPIPVVLTNEVTLWFYPPSDDEYVEILEFRAGGLRLASKAKQMQINTKDENTAIESIPGALSVISDAREMLDHLNAILSRLSDDKSFTPEAFRSMPRHYKMTILDALTNYQKVELDKVKKFRGKSKRARVGTDANGVEHQ